MKTLIKRGEYTTSFQLTELRLKEIAGVCLPCIKVENQIKSVNSEITEITEKKEIIEKSGAFNNMELILKEIVKQKTDNTQKTETDKMMLEQALSLRKQMLVDKIVNDNWRMKKQADVLRKDYDKGQTVAALSLKYEQFIMQNIFLYFIFIISFFRFYSVLYFLFFVFYVIFGFSFSFSFCTIHNTHTLTHTLTNSIIFFLDLICHQLRSSGRY